MGSEKLRSEQLSWLVVFRGWERGPWSLGQVNFSDLSELLHARNKWLQTKQYHCIGQELGSSKMSYHGRQAEIESFCVQPEPGPLGYFALSQNQTRNKGFIFFFFVLHAGNAEPEKPNHFARMMSW